MTDKFKLIGFDLDGTLVNSLPDIVLSLNQTFKEAGLPYFVEDETALPWIGNGADVFFAKGLAWAGLDTKLSAEAQAELKKRYIHFYGQNLCTKSTLFPKVKETLSTLKKQGYLLAVVTNKPSHLVEPVLKAFGIGELFSEMLGGHSLPALKPHPAPIYYLCGKFGLYPHEILFVGDSRNDILAAQAAGCESVGLTYGYNYNEPIADSKPTYVFDDFADILTVVNK